jgi:benzoate-CoA ligase
MKPERQTMSTVTARTLEDLPERFNATVDLLEPNLLAGRGARVAIIDENGATTYAELARRVDRMAGAFAGLGIGRDQRVLLCLLDTVDFPTVFLGAIKAGVIPVPLNTSAAADDYRWILANSGASAVVVSPECVPEWRQIADDHPEIAFISVGDGPWPKLDALLDAANPLTQAADTHREDVAFWLYTSGSTGRPKGAMHIHGSMRLTANLFGSAVIGYGEDDVVLSVAKQFFAYGLGNALTFPLAAGSTVVLLKDRAVPPAISALIKRHKVSILAGVPSFFAKWFDSPDTPSREEAPHLRIGVSAGEYLPTHLGEAFRQRFGTDIIDGLGSTEMLHIYLAQRPGEVRFGCTGRPVPGYELRIVGDDDEVVPAGEIGELQVRGPTAAQGYWRNRTKSLGTFVGGWTRTGDKYRCDADGWYFYAGRSDDMLKVNGLYVSPNEVEEALASHEAVLEAAVIGKPDGNDLVKPCAHVVLRDGRQGDEALAVALKAHVKDRIAGFKCPHWIIFAETLPKTATGKIQRFRLREMA